MKSKRNHPEVLIVGAGPTGLTLAVELARRGISFRLIDKSDSPSDKSRALAVQARTLELFHKMGIAEKLIETGRTTLKAAVWVKGRKRIDLECGDLSFADTPYPFVLFTSQVETETLLNQSLNGLGGQVERGVELVSFTQTESEITAIVRSKQGEETVSARYLVGCDGAHSVVRKVLGLKFEGAPYLQDFMLADVELDWDLSPDRFRLFFGKKELLAVFPMKGNLVRLVGTREKSPESEAAPSLAEIESFARRVTGQTLSLKNPFWLTRFRLHHRGVDRYSVGRGFVAGDAAHIHSPAGGQGMNTGIQDAYNLAWKLEWVLKGLASSQLLSTYHAERFPVGQFLLNFTDRLFQMVSSGNPVLVFARNHLFWRLGKWVLSDPNRRRKAFRTLSQLGIRYASSSYLKNADSNSLGPKVGERAPDVKVGKASLFSLLGGTEAHFLCFSSENNPPIGKIPLVVHHLKRSPESNEAFEKYGVGEKPAFYFIRPDGHVGFRSFGESFKAWEAYLQSL